MRVAARLYNARRDMARDMRSRLIERYPDVMATGNIGHKPNDALFHAEANALLRAAEPSGGSLAGRCRSVRTFIDSDGHDSRKLKPREFAEAPGPVAGPSRRLRCGGHASDSVASALRAAGVQGAAAADRPRSNRRGTLMPSSLNPSSLNDDVATLASAITAHAGRFEPIGRIDWPDGARIAVNFTADFDAMLLRRLANEPTLQLAKGEFGGRVGIWRLIELFDSNAVKATIFTPGRICELYPQAVQAAARGGHEVADHMWEHRVPDEIALERDHLRKTVAALERLTGRRPVGTRSGHTAALLKAEGFIYNSHGSETHGPCYVRDADGGNCLVGLPFHYAIDDAMYFSMSWLQSEMAAQRISDPDRVMDMWWAGFRQQYDQGGYFNICLHPFVSGRALRIAMLDRLIRRMKELPGVWFPTCEAVARHCLANHPPKRGAF